MRNYILILCALASLAFRPAPVIVEMYLPEATISITAETMTEKYHDLATRLPFNLGDIIIAHSYLAGTNFYDLNLLDHVTVEYSDGTFKLFEVRKISALIGDVPKTVTTKLFMDGAWVNVSDAILNHIHKDGIVMVTCLTNDHGRGEPTGRLFVELSPHAKGK